MKRAAVIIGTRPEAIKMAPVVLALREAGLAAELILTGQHRDMLAPILDLFGLAPDADLDLMAADQTLTHITRETLHGLEQHWAARGKPDWVLVQGDTTSAFAAALAAFYAGIPVGHVEAGLRTGNPHNPWPEEMNRRLATQLAQLHFAPTERARTHLLRENVADSAILVTGNTVVDALLWVRNRLQTDAALARQAASCVALDPSRRLILSTSHRRENWGGGITRVCQALRTLVEQRPDTELVFPVHPNPTVRQAAQAVLGGLPRVHLIEPQSYLSFVWLMTRAHLIVTDSGGVQEEAPSLGVPVLVTRDTTERPEAVEAGTVRLVGTDVTRILAHASALLDDPAAHARMAHTHNPYGDGHAAPRIAARLAAPTQDRRPPPSS